MRGENRASAARHDVRPRTLLRIRVLWWILGIVILLIVFWIGVKAGEFRDELHSCMAVIIDYGYHPMMQGDGGYGGGSRGPGIRCDRVVP